MLLKLPINAKMDPGIDPQMFKTGYSNTSFDSFGALGKKGPWMIGSYIVGVKFQSRIYTYSMVILAHRISNKVITISKSRYVLI